MREHGVINTPVSNQSRYFLVVRLLSGSKSKATSQEELNIRLKEDALFEKLRNPPPVDRVGGHLLEDS